MTLSPAYIIEPLGGRLVIGGPGERTLFAGDTGVGKTWAILWLLQQLQVPTLYIATEAYHQIAKRIAHEPQKYDKRLILESTPTAERIKELVSICDDKNIELIIFDVVAPMLPDENNASSYQDFLKFISPIAETRSTILVHHYGKDSSKGARGSSAMEAQVSYDYRITNPKKTPHTKEIEVLIKHNKKDTGGNYPKGAKFLVNDGEIIYFEVYSD